MTFQLKDSIVQYLSETYQCDTKDKQLQFIFKGVAQGLLYMHEEMQLANRDIKPDNILFTTSKRGTNPAHPDRA